MLLGFAFCFYFPYGLHHSVDPAFLAIMGLHLKRRDSFFLFLKNHFLENGLESPLIFVLF